MKTDTNKSVQTNKISTEHEICDEKLIDNVTDKNIFFSYKTFNCVCFKQIGLHLTSQPHRKLP